MTTDTIESLRAQLDALRAERDRARAETDRTHRQIALSLDWGNVPPLDVLVRDIRARAVGAAKTAADLTEAIRERDEARKQQSKAEGLAEMQAALRVRAEAERDIARDALNDLRRALAKPPETNTAGPERTERESRGHGNAALAQGVGSSPTPAPSKPPETKREPERIECGAVAHARRGVKNGTVCARERGHAGDHANAFGAIWTREPSAPAEAKTLQDELTCPRCGGWRMVHAMVAIDLPREWEPCPDCGGSGVRR